MLTDNFDDFGRLDSVLVVFAGSVDLNHDLQLPVLLGPPGVQLFGEFDRRQRLDHRQPGNLDDLADLVGLEVADEVPLNVRTLHDGKKELQAR